MNYYNYRVNHSVPLSDRVLQVFVTPSDQHHLTYRAGQYVEIGLSTDERRPFSIANAPLGAQQLEFHIRHTPDDPFAIQLLQDLRDEKTLRLHGPLGKCTLQSTAHPIVMIAGGTGFAPLKALMEELLATGIVPAVHLFWGATSESDLYLDSVPQQWLRHVSNFQYTPVLSNPNRKASWPGAVGKVMDVVLQQYPTWQEQHVYVQGPYPMVAACRDKLCQHGLPKQHIFSDSL